VIARPEPTVKQTPVARRLWKRIPAATAFILLACQVAIPWTVPHFITGDGPSHLYGATVARELLIHHNRSIYSPVYTIQRTVLPNWTATILLAAAGAVAGTEHAEQLFASLVILLGFLGLCYVNRALAPDESPWTPLMNFLVQTWFLWIGFYNFYLGMALLPFLIGFYIRNSGRLNFVRTAVIAMGLTLLFFTHLIAVALALMALAVIALWLNIVVPMTTGAGSMLRRFAELGAMLLAAAPALILSSMFLYDADGAVEKSTAHIESLIRTFPQHIFLTAAGTFGKQAYLWPLVLCYIIAGTFAMTGKEWASARGGLVIAALLAFLAYLFVPDQGLGGSAVIIRFAWAVFIFGGLVAASASRLRIIRVPFALCVAVLLAGNTIASARTASAVSDAVDSYLTAASRIPRNATIIRLLYPAPGAPAHYGYQGIARPPFFHLDGLVAARKHDLDLTDYEPLTRLFPVVNKENFDGQRSQLWGFEGPDTGAVRVLKWVRETFPLPVDFVLLFGDEHSAEAIKEDMPAMLFYLNSNMHLVTTSTDGLLRIFARDATATSR
jgi:hypothetical protein